MSALLKAGDPLARSAVHLSGGQGPRKAATSLARADASATGGPRLDDEQPNLEAVIAELRRRLADAENEADAREDAAFERGRLEGEELANGETEKRLERLREGLEAMRASHSACCVEYELLALQVARAALGRVFGDEGLQTELLTEAIAQGFARTTRDLVLGVRVSPRDFRSEDELQILAARFPGIEISRDETLDAGGCSINLKLGTIDLGLPGQWQRLTAFFEGLANSENAE